MFGPGSQFPIRKCSRAAFTESIIANRIKNPRFLEFLDPLGPLVDLGASFDQGRIDPCFLKYKILHPFKKERVKKVKKTEKKSMKSAGKARPAAKEK